MAIEIMVLRSGDKAVLMNVADDVFDNPIDAKLTKEFLEDRRHHIAVAIDDGVVVGFASAIDYIHPDKPPELYINEVGLAPTHQRRGLGKAVLKALFDEGRAHNCRVAWTVTDRSNTAAAALKRGDREISLKRSGFLPAPSSIKYRQYFRQHLVHNCV